MSGIQTPGLAGIVVHTSDFIAEGDRSHFNGFEGITNAVYPGDVYAENTITVETINGTGTTGTSLAFAGASGNRTWYTPLEITSR